MRLGVVVATLALASGAFTPSAEAHVCQVETENSGCLCPTQDDGNAHDHKTPRGNCSASSHAGPFGAPIPGALLAVAALGFVAAAIRRR